MEYDSVRSLLVDTNSAQIQPLPSSQQRTVNNLAEVVSFFSLSGALLIIFSTLLFKDLRKNQTRKILAFWGVGQLIYDVALILPNQDVADTNDTICTLQAALTVLGANISYLWAIFFSINIFLSIVGNSKLKTIYYSWHVVAWGYPIFITVFAFFKGVYGIDEGIATAYWCWISSSSNVDALWRLLAGKILQWISWTIVLVLMIAIQIALHKLTRNHPTIAKKKNYMAKKMIIVPLFYVLFGIPGGIRTISSFFAVDKVEFIMAILQALMSPMQGFVNAVVFVFAAPKIRQNWKDLFRKGFLRNKESYSLNVNNVVENDDFDYTAEGWNFKKNTTTPDPS